MYKDIGRHQHLLRSTNGVDNFTISQIRQDLAANSIALRQLVALPASEALALEADSMSHLYREVPPEVAVKARNLNSHIRAFNAQSGRYDTAYRAATGNLGNARLSAQLAIEGVALEQSRATAASSLSSYQLAMPLSAQWPLIDPRVVGYSVFRNGARRRSRSRERVGPTQAPAIKTSRDRSASPGRTGAARGRRPESPTKPAPANRGRDSDYERQPTRERDRRPDREEQLFAAATSAASAAATSATSIMAAAITAAIAPALAATARRDAPAKLHDYGRASGAAATNARNEAYAFDNVWFQQPRKLSEAQRVIHATILNRAKVSRRPDGSTTPPPVIVDIPSIAWLQRQAGFTDTANHFGCFDGFRAPNVTAAQTKEAFDAACRELWATARPLGTDLLGGNFNGTMGAAFLHADARAQNTRAGGFYSPDGAYVPSLDHDACVDSPLNYAAARVISQGQLSRAPDYMEPLHRAMAVASTGIDVLTTPSYAALERCLTRRDELATHLAIYTSLDYKDAWSILNGMPWRAQRQPSTGRTSFRGTRLQQSNSAASSDAA